MTENFADHFLKIGAGIERGGSRLSAFALRGDDGLVSTNIITWSIAHDIAGGERLVIIAD